MTDTPAPAEYRVLARKYRPQSFATLLGQQTMVRTLTNALHSGRLAHAFILTGVRGVGKTTTARIIARALNCVGADEKGGPTPEPCGVCEHCRAITEDRHMDVLEMDAASRTGVEDIRELIDGVRYAPVNARFKVYIIDEVHMLSRSAFNALLKTLEEPPPHVRFIFATTEPRKVPVTVLSRCQRFDLRRVDAATLIEHFSDIAAREKVDVEAAALALIARTAEGSVRDGLSLLDQAIAHGAGTVREDQVRGMLGLADRARVLDLFEAVMSGQAPRALDLLGEDYAAGADPVAVLQDMLELTHWLSRLKVVPEAGGDVTVSEEGRTRGREMAAKLSMPILARTWQMLLRGLDETRRSLAPLAAAEMALLRLIYAADLPPPAELVREIQAEARTGPAAGSDGGAARASAPMLAATPPAGARTALKPAAGAAPQAEAKAPPAPRPRLENFAAVVALATERGETALHAELEDFVHIVRFEPGRIEFRPAAGAPADLANRLATKLSAWTGERWVVSVSRDQGAPTLGQAAPATRAGGRRQLQQDPLVRAVLEAFPGAELREIRELDDKAENGEHGLADGHEGLGKEKEKR